MLKSIKVYKAEDLTMNNRLLHTPEGVRDIYGKEYARKLAVEQKLQNAIHCFGYEDIQTPSIEFFDVFSKEIGTTPSKELYKFSTKKEIPWCCVRISHLLLPVVLQSILWKKITSSFQL